MPDSCRGYAHCQSTKKQPCMPRIFARNPRRFKRRRTGAFPVCQRERHVKKLYAFSQHGLSCAEHTHKPLLARVHICAFPCACCENVSLGVPRVSFTYFACCSGLHRHQFPKPYRLYFTTYPCIKQLFCKFFCSALRQNLRFLPTCPHGKHNIVCALLTGRYFHFLDFFDVSQGKNIDFCAA